MIPYGRQDISPADIDAVIKVLQSDFLTQGPAVPKFEALVCESTGAKFGVAVNSATSALHIACEALGLTEGDYLWTTPITFVASANCGLYCGAQVDFVDIDPVSWNLSTDCLRRKLQLAAKEKRLPKVLVVVHLCGLSCEMATIHALSREYGFFVIEDASHAIGGSYLEKPVGNCLYSDITVFSFHPVKIITTGEGGMAVTQSRELAEKMDLLRSHGITRNSTLMSHEPDGPWYYQQISLGYNYRMTDIQAALGISQLQRLGDFVRKRHEIADRYDTLLADLPFQLPFRSEESYSALHLYVVRLQTDQIDKSHMAIFELLRAAGIGVNLHYIPVHTQPFYQQFGFQQGDFPEAEKYYKEAISLPMYPALTRGQQDTVVRALQEALA